jgi:sec-independent protein translocase protein TatA
MIPGLPGPFELLIILLIVLVIFGASRLTDIMGAFGKGIAEFRRGASVEEPPKEEVRTEPPATPKA